MFNHLLCGNSFEACYAVDVTMDQFGYMIPDVYLLKTHKVCACIRIIAGKSAAKYVTCVVNAGKGITCT
jgi:hypothetical protein